MPRRIGYARVSTDEQIIETQIHLLKEAGCELVFADQGESGAKIQRPQLDMALDSLEEGDTLVVYRLDRLVLATQRSVLAALRGRPGKRPLRAALRNPAIVRSRMICRSSSATAARI